MSIYSALLYALVGFALLVGALLFFAFLDRFLKVSPCIEKANEIGFDESNIHAGYSEKKLEQDLAEGPFDCIVVGSGIGGLTTAAMLSRRGKRVLVLEQHDVIGGCTHTFEEKGYEFDTGIHYVGGEVGDSRSPMGFIFDLLTLGRLKWTKIEGCFDVARISKVLADQNLGLLSAEEVKDAHAARDLVLKIRSADSLYQDLLSRYPEEKDALESFFRLCKWGEIVFPLFAVYISLPRILTFWVSWAVEPVLKIFFGSSTYTVLSSLTKNEDLIGALTWCYGNSGLTPKEGAFIMSAIMVSHYDKGAFYPTGGTAEIAKNMVPVIIASRGKAYVRAPVSSIVLNASGTDALGVVVRGKTILAPCVVSAAGVLCTYTKLIDDKVLCRHATYVRSVVTRKHTHKRGPTEVGLIGPSCSMFSVFVGLKGNAKELNLPAYNTWLYPHWRHDVSASQYRQSLQESNQGPPFIPLVFVSFSSAKDGLWTERYPDKSVVELLTIADYDSFVACDKKTGSQSKPGARGKDYDAYKQELVDQIMKVFRDEFPALSDCIDLVMGASPLTNNFYIGSTSGEIYGLEQSVSRFTTGRSFLQPRQPIRNLYLSGQDAMSNGLAGAMFGGLSCAIAVDISVIVDIVASFISAI